MKVSTMIESKYLKQEDVGDGVTVTIKGFKKTNVAREDEEAQYKYVMFLEEFEKPLVLNSTNIQLCTKILGSDDTDDWIGKKVILYTDENVSFAGKLTGGIRVRRIVSKKDEAVEV